MDDIRKPDFTKPVDIAAFLRNHFGVCGCSEVGPIVRAIVYFLTVVSKGEFSQLTDLDVGVYYIIVGIADDAGLVNHGTSLRGAFLTELGREFLAALETIPIDNIENASGPTYAGFSIPEVADA